MELAIYLFLLYIVSSIIVSIEGGKHQVGGVNAFLFSLLLTPIIGFVIVRFSSRKATVSHYVKRSECNECLFNEDSSDEACKLCEENAHWVKV